MSAPRSDVPASFWQKVDKGTEDGCWIWTGARHRKGYGRFAVANRRKVYAHRYSWELAHGPIPDGLFVLHRCDNPPCVNPGHLFLGTNQDNMRDAAAKGRLVSRAKLTEAIVTSMRRRHAAGTASIIEPRRRGWSPCRHGSFGHPSRQMEARCVNEPTPRQLEVLVAYVECGGSKEAARRLQVSDRHIRGILSALHAIIGGANSAQTFAIAVQRGLIDPHELHIDEAA